MNLRIPPNSREDERAVLGAILLVNDAFADVAGIVRAEDFYREEHRLVFAAMGALREIARPLDILTLGDYLRAAGTLEGIGGLTYLNSLLDAVPTAANVEHYARSVRNKSLLRQIISVAHEMASEAYDAMGDAEELAGRAIAALGAMNDGNPGADVVTMAEVVSQVSAEIDAAHKAGRSVSSVSTGIVAVDDAFGGQRRGTLAILAARPGTGKTVTMMRLAEAAAEDSGKPALVISLEMQPVDLGMRMLSGATGINSRALLGGQLRTTREWSSVYRECETLAKVGILFAKSALKATHIRALVRRYATRGGLSGVYIDYLGLMESENPDARHDIQLGQITRTLKLMSGEYRLPVMLLVQLNRKGEDRGPEAPPKLSDLRDSGRIEEDADTVVVLQRDQTNETTKRVLKWWQLKGRNVGTGYLELEFSPEHTRIVSPAPAPRLTDGDARGDVLDFKARAAGEREDV